MIHANRSAGKEAVVQNTGLSRREGLFSDTWALLVSLLRKDVGVCAIVSPAVEETKHFQRRPGKVLNTPFFSGNCLGNFALERHLEENSAHIRHASLGIVTQ